MGRQAGRASDVHRERGNRAAVDGFGQLIHVMRCDVAFMGVRPEVGFREDRGRPALPQRPTAAIMTAVGPNASICGPKNGNAAGLNFVGQGHGSIRPT